MSRPKNKNSPPLKNSNNEIDSKISISTSEPIATNDDVNIQTSTKNAEDMKRTYVAIKDFVNDLNEVFSNLRSMKLYHRLLENIKVDVDTVGIQKCITGFKVFFTNYEKKLESVELLMEIPRDTYIRYGDSPNVFLEIQKYLYKATKDQKEIIRRHLLTIAASIDPSERTLSVLESSSPVLEKMGLSSGTQEGRFVEAVMNKAKKAMENTETDDPTTAIMGLFSSGVITDMVKGLQSGVNNKTMDVNKLLTGMQGALSGIIEAAKEENEDDEDDDNDKETNGNSEDEDPNSTLEGLVTGIQDSLNNKNNKAKALKKSLNAMGKEKIIDDCEDS